MNPKDMIIDFLNTTVMILLIAFCVFFFIVGDYFYVATLIARSMMYTAVLGILFTIKLKYDRQKIKTFKKHATLDEVAVYFGKYDKLIALGFNAGALLCVLAFSFLDGTFDKLSIIFIIVIGLISALWHLILFRQKDQTVEKFYATNGEKINDQLIIFFIPVIMMALTLFGEGVNMLRVLQIFFVFILLYARHHYLFRNKK